jgi:hypothetical protein
MDINEALNFLIGSGYVGPNDIEAMRTGLEEVKAKTGGLPDEPEKLRGIFYSYFQVTEIRRPAEMRQRSVES